MVGIGASAGGLESLELLFAALPSDTGMAFIVVQHLSPNFRSLMDELIARHSGMPVVIAEDGMAVEADHIYVMPPRKEMIIRDRRLWLSDKEPHTFSLPIDAFFRSLALDVGDSAVAIVLSGSGSDGSRGILDVKRAGGLVLAETTSTAQFDGMPGAAIGTGVVDHVHAPADLARVLCGLQPVERAAVEPALSEDPTMDAVLRLLRDGFGIDFSQYKVTTVGRRIRRRLEILRHASLATYVDQLRNDPDELDKLYQDLLIGVTQFFRDPGAFDALEREVVPELLERLKPDEELRVWVAGCATGEEPYSLAMVLSDAFTSRGRAPRLRILATDVHQRSLDFASAGVYGEEQLSNVSADRLERFFVRRSSGYQISADLRQQIVFARHNVTKDAPFTRMHLISCRNLLIYLQPPAQRTVLSLFHFGLVPGGTLFLGGSETAGALGDELVAIDDHWKLFRKRRNVHLLHQVRLPVARGGHGPELPRASGTDPLLLAQYDQLLDKFMPPALLVDEQRNLIDVFGGAEKLLRMKPRRPTHQVHELLTDDLRTVVAGAIQRALKDRTTVAYAGVRIPGEGSESRCTVGAEPLVHPRTGARNVLVTFRPMTAEDRLTSERPAIPMSEASHERMATLEAELGYTRETLQTTIEELETSNEEMQATNEELVASNEELQSTNEELHSVNEELYTVNAEYQQKIIELKEVNADLAHLLESTDMGTVFLDRDLRIRRYTSRMAGVFRFQAHDLGRRIDDFSHNIDRPQLMDELARALDGGSVIEDEVCDRAGTPYFLRVLPYRVGASIDGVVLTLTDISSLAAARAEIVQLLEESKALSRRRDEFLAMLSHELRNPLAAVVNGTTVLRQGPTPAIRERCEHVIERQAGQMKRLLDDLLDVSRITSGKFTVGREHLDLRDAISSAIEATEPAFAERKVALVTDLPDSLPVEGDLRRLTQVITNLLANASTYSPPGRQVTLTAEVRDAAIHVRVHDDGDGIAPDLLPKIFELFVQSDQKLDRSRGGLGVGLSLAKKIVELHDGTIEAHSPGHGAGTDFDIVLPRAAPRAAAPALADSRAPRRIVVVDDQDDSREMLRVLFEQHAHEVFDAADGPRAIHLILERHPDVAFIDIGLPGMNGFEVARQIRGRPELADVRLVALSGYGTHRDIQDALAAGFDAHVTKPAEFPQLERLLGSFPPLSR